MNYRPQSSVITPTFLNTTKDKNTYHVEISSDNILGVRNPNSQGMPFLPPDHPHVAALDTENIAPSDGKRQPRTPIKENVPSKRSKSAVSLRALVGSSRRSPEKGKKSPEKPMKEKTSGGGKPQLKKTKSSTGLSSIFGKRDRTNKDPDETVVRTDNVENQETKSTSKDLEAPIWAQFTTRVLDESVMQNPKVRSDVSNIKLKAVKDAIDVYTPKEYNPSVQRDFQGYMPTLSRPGSSSSSSSTTSRPKSAIFSLSDLQRVLQPNGRTPTSSKGSYGSGKSQSIIRPHSIHYETARQVSGGSSVENTISEPIAVVKRNSRSEAASTAVGSIMASPVKDKDVELDSVHVNTAFEAVLERRNIPEDQRKSMRSLTLHIKADFVKQDKRSSSPVKTVAQESQDITKEQGSTSKTSPRKRSGDESPTKRGRPRSRTFNFSRSESSPSKKQNTDRPTSIYDTPCQRNTADKVTRTRSASIGPPATPQNYVNYLREMIDPKQAEVGRVHKLRILLRNETVNWVDKFVELGGMVEILALLGRIMVLEWRDDHEDQLLHETLLCLKGIATTKVAIEKLSLNAHDLFPKLLGMLFDEEKKGPSEFATRSIVMNILFTYLADATTASSAALTARAREIMQYLQDQDKKGIQPLPFVVEMRSRRPYRTWCREITNVTKEVFWIFLHNQNVIPTTFSSNSQSDGVLSSIVSESNLANSFTKRYFPGTRPPVPAAPYTGGVEWDATMYITSHLDIMNGLLASLPSTEDRNAFRADLRSSGWEKIMGNTLRTCKEKFYTGVHDALRTWTTAAVEDGWDVDFVSQGIMKEGLTDEVTMALMSPGKKFKVSKKEKEAITLPVLDLGPSSVLGGEEKMTLDVKGDEDGWFT